jgi:hypothetical protein
MPCCPSKAPMPSGCDKCIFMAACAAKCFTSMTLALFQPRLRTSAGAIRRRRACWRPLAFLQKRCLAKNSRMSLAISPTL